MFDYTLTAAKILFKEQEDEAAGAPAAEKAPEQAEEQQAPLPAT